MRVSRSRIRWSASYRDRFTHSNRYTKGNRSSNPPGQQKRRSGPLASRLQNRHTLNVMCHRRGVGLAEPQKDPGQKDFAGGSFRTRMPRASSERRGRQSVPHHKEDSVRGRRAVLPGGSFPGANDAPGKVGGLSAQDRQRLIAMLSWASRGSPRWGNQTRSSEAAGRPVGR